jgi:hypothetical protein
VTRLLDAPAGSASVGTVRVVDGRAAVGAALPSFDALAGRCGTPVTGRAAWTLAQLEASATAQPWAVLVSAGAQRRAAAVLLTRSGGSGPRLVLAGGGEGGYRAGMAALDDPAGEVLADALARELAVRARRGDVVELGPLPDGVAVRRLAHQLHAERVLCDPVPRVCRAGGRELEGYVSHGVRRTLRKSVNRLTTEGRTHTIAFSTDAATVERWLPAMERAYRDRDAEHGVVCQLDSQDGRRLWRARIRHLLAAGSLELATLSIDSHLAAYTLGTPCGDWYGLLEGRFVTRWARFAPGRLLEAAVLQRVLDDDRYEGLDWMTSVAPEKLLAANGAEADVVLRCRLAGAERRWGG